MCRTPHSAYLRFGGVRNGDVIAGRYRLVEQIGRGGMGVVWKAVDLELRREVALKAGDAEQVRREARIGAGLRHPNVIVVFDVVEDDGKRWLVLEHLPSRSLAEILRTAGPVPPDRVARIGAQIADALAAMHEEGMVHRDITPGNVLVTGDGTAKLTDLGIATWANVTVTGAESIAGTSGYMAPEVVRGEIAVPASDVYSLGATLSAAIEGAPAGAELRAVLADLTRAEPTARPSATAAAQRLRDIGGGAPARPHRAIIATGAALIVVLLVVVAGLLLKSSGTEPDSAATFVGDPKTADPCGLVDLNKLKAFGDDVRMDDVGQFNECAAHVSLREHGSVEMDVRVWLVTGPDHDSFEKKYLPPYQNHHVQREELNGDQCRRIVFLPAPHRVVISAWQNQQREVLCQAAEAMSEGVVDAYRRGQLLRRDPPAPESLASGKACDLLTTAELAEPLASQEVVTEPGFADWECYWITPEADPAVQITFVDAGPVEPDDGRPRWFAGREGLLKAEGVGSNKCLAAIIFRKYLDDGNERTERVEIVWRSDEQTSDARCAGAARLAEIIAKKLPAR